MATLEFKRIPMDWVNEEVMRSLTWKRGEGSINSSALMLYVALCAHASLHDNLSLGLKDGEACPRYEELQRFCDISRDQISKGLDKLVSLGVIKRKKVGVRTKYSIVHITDLKQGKLRFGKIPYKAYSINGEFKCVFQGLDVRKKVTLHALKLFYAIIKFRNNTTNYASISYEKLSAFTGIPTKDIKGALQVLYSNKLVVVDLVKSIDKDYRHNIYRVVGIRPKTHLATLSEDVLDYIGDFSNT